MLWLIPIPLVAFLLIYFIRTFIRVRRMSQVRRELHLQMMRDACLCVKCGYDVRRNTTGRCPECGAVIER